MRPSAKELIGFGKINTNRRCPLLQVVSVFFTLKIRVIRLPRKGRRRQVWQTTNDCDIFTRGAAAARSGALQHASTCRLTVSHGSEPNVCCPLVVEVQESIFFCSFVCCV